MANTGTPSAGPALKKLQNIQVLFLKITQGLEIGKDVITNLVQSNPNPAENAEQVKNIVALPQADYDAIPIPDPSTVYLIVEP